MRKPAVLVTGANGQLGSEIKKLSTNYNDYSFVFTDIKDLDITKISELKKSIKKNNIDIIINCAAYTAVDKVETDMKNAAQINTFAPKNLAELSSKYNILLIHISTDYVFDGTSYRPYVETDKTNPNTAYGITKLNGELEVITHATKAVIIRTSWLYSSTGKNFVKTILKIGKEKGELNVVFDQVGTPTYAYDLAKGILDSLPQMRVLPTKEIYNFSNEGAISWYDFAKEIIDIAGIDCKINPIETKDFPTPAKRPPYSVLNKAKFKNDFKTSIPYWRNSLIKCIEELKNN